ncbi:protein spaetzle-like [Nymphalis io]|uniref:protein spaetzle-like n=1 Tax=Inachis io TaxID=171585 RepID=UPI0021698E6C|nr:protein spaetzle-like [Nymphalis io]
MAMKQSFVIFIITVLLQSARASTNGQTLLPWNEIEWDTILEPPKISSDCEHYEICNKVLNYPMKFVTSLLEQLKTKNITKFTIDKLQADNGDYENICSFKEEIYYPRAAKDSNGNWHYILNGNPQAFQGFLVERCKKDGCPLGPFSTDYTLNCIQNIGYRIMVYLDIEKRGLAVNHFKIPICCSCTLIK